MPTPVEVFEQPALHWDFLTVKTDTAFEGQVFDRKEVCRIGHTGNVGSTDLDKLKGHITACVSAFANTNKNGSLLVLGISKTGQVKGFSHLSDNQRNSVTNINELLAAQSARMNFFVCQNEEGVQDEICLIFVPYTEMAICETLGNSPRSWARHSSQNICQSDAQRDQLRRDKKIVNFEAAYCCPYQPRDLDQGVLQEFRLVFLEATEHNYTDEEMLYQAGALDKSGGFTNAGLLFFASNPQRVLSWSYIRLFRFEASVSRTAERGLPTFDRDFTGPISKQIRNLRTFVQESAFFKTYPKRNRDGGFTDEPEYPYIAVDEAIVNAVAHRDYAIQLPTECEAYRDGLLVRNPGRIQQRDHDVPERFSLDSVTLVHTPRNSKLIEWLRMMRDERGKAFVRAISEGTKSMRVAMAELKLPTPSYEVSDAQTTVKLLNNVTEREALLQTATKIPPTEFVNLFPLTFVLKDGQMASEGYVDQRRRDISAALRDALKAKRWFIHSDSYGRVVAHRQGAKITLPEDVVRVVKLFPAYSFQIRQYLDRYYLCIDYTLQVRSVKPVQELLDIFKPSNLIGKSVLAQWNGWQRGKIVSVDEEFTRVYLFDYEREEQVASNKVIPNLTTAMIDTVLVHERVNFDLHRAKKQHSFSLEPGASRTRAERTEAVAIEISQNVFPLQVNGMQVSMQPSPTALVRQSGDSHSFHAYTLPEPSVEFNHHREGQDIREGITRFGSYDNSPKSIELIPICTVQMRDNMIALIKRLQTGAYKYRGAERTFGTRLSYNTIISIPSPDSALGECRRLLEEHPEWVGDKQLGRLFLVHTPERGYAADDENAPYYRVKRFLLEKGVPCQMIDTPTLLNPDWKDLNLALNIIAKCGVTPWLLPDAIPDADFFVGLSYTQSNRQGFERQMGYANVFNQYGRWAFYAGNTATFAYEERTSYFAALVHQTLERLDLPDSPSIYFHYSAKFSREDRAAILEAARSVRPRGAYSFVWINTDHNIRLYDSRAETDGSLGRGSYVVASPKQMYLSTTGYNPYRKVLGTPVMLEVNIWAELAGGRLNRYPDLKALANQILSLTKLNWASTDSLCAEPITTKYAHDIAYLTAAFLRHSDKFILHPVLEKTPWFI